MVLFLCPVVRVTGERMTYVVRFFYARKFMPVVCPYATITGERLTMNGCVNGRTMPERYTNNMGMNFARLVLFER